MIPEKLVKTISKYNLKHNKNLGFSFSSFLTLTQENMKLEELSKSFQDEIALLKIKITQYEDEYEKFTDCN